MKSPIEHLNIFRNHLLYKFINDELKRLKIEEYTKLLKDDEELTAGIFYDAIFGVYTIYIKSGSDDTTEPVALTKLTNQDKTWADIALKLIDAVDELEGVNV